MQCPPGLEFNPNLLVCDFDWESGCKSEDFLAVAVSESRADPRCPTENEGNVTLLPHPTNCSLYLECVNGNITIMQCPPGLEFNPNLLVCDFDWESGCKSEDYLAVAVSESRADPRCPAENEGNVTLLPHPTNCSLYLECVNGNITVMQCPPGLEFNPNLLVCDFDWESGCKSEDFLAVAVSESRADPRCPTENEGNVTLLPHPTNCSLYLECVNGNITIMQCPPGLEFNPNLLVCDFDWESGCKSEDYLAVAVSESRADSRCPAENEGNVTLLPHPTNCSLYLECVNGNITIMQCPPGLEFNPNLLVCDFDWESGCKSEDFLAVAVSESRADPRCPAENEGNVTLLPHPTNCSLYLECVNGNITIMQCPPGLEFNPDLLVCDYDWESGCISEGKRARADPVCPKPGQGGSDTLLFPKPNNCSQYFECDNGNLLVMECPQGLEFSPTDLVCDHPWSAKCTPTTEN
ncbi:chondroitin proteoglycan 2-like [Anabrus simplex]|uniref:chondroitin proteoglycan 2-like n=1 Tax=Anabrus simplex TaxID=316456 RepID=UPI0035A29543